MTENADKNDQRPRTIFQPDVTPITLKEYARITNQPLSTVQSQADKGQIPTFKPPNCRIRYVNRLQMFLACAEAAGWDIKAPSLEYSL
ncbi:hypothetical protein [Shewanella sp. MTB7]|uniref:hypothetical protein n=1 Tax=Shewanella sp. MTB7 TaxID=2746932 RepID=UPI0022BA15B3|nr:hypothetical protein [Shewanella sp. MTB7]WBJ95724.1 hypothetical protein HWQ47_00875 [Shewanella sp. MTB7]